MKTVGKLSIENFMAWHPENGDICIYTGFGSASENDNLKRLAKSLGERGIRVDFFHLAHGQTLDAVKDSDLAKVGLMRIPKLVEA